MCGVRLTSFKQDTFSSSKRSPGNSAANPVFKAPQSSSLHRPLSDPHPEATESFPPLFHQDPETKGLDATFTDGLVSQKPLQNWLLGHLKESSQGPKLEESEQQNKIILDYNPKYTVNIHESILI